MNLRPHLAYLRYLARHKWFVFLAGRKTGAPLWRLVIHDWSKFLPMEWSPYVRRFFSGRAGLSDKSNDSQEFHRAWTHHWHANPHHWEHWLALDNGRVSHALEMPGHFVREMVADWMGAGRAITGKWEVMEWYRRNHQLILLHPDTRLSVELLLQRVTPKLALAEAKKDEAKKEASSAASD